MVRYTMNNIYMIHSKDMVTTLRSDSMLVAFETLYLDWIRNIAIFVVAALALLTLIGMEDIAYWLFVLSLYLLIIAQVDYFHQRSNLVENNINIPLRIDLLWIGSTLFLVIGVLVLCKASNTSMTKNSLFVKSHE